MSRKSRLYTVVGINGVTLQRCSHEVFARNPLDAENEAYAENADLLIAAVFEGKPFPVDSRAQSTKYQVNQK